MKPQKIVVALGGNALGDTPEEQLRLSRHAAVPIVDLIEAGHQVILAHGNGPQVGMIQLAMSRAAQLAVTPAEMPLPECGAMSQGYIGYHLQNSIQNELARRGVRKNVATLITQVVVRGDDPEFDNPTKPIGAFYDKAQMEALRAEKGYLMKQDANRGYRRVVPSPTPVDIVEKDVVRELLVQGVVTITVGGGGIPVVRGESGYTGVSAVVDKDLAAAVLAELVDADLFIILTAVESVALHFGLPNQTNLRTMRTAQAERYCAEGQFAPGSMLPKVRAAIRFVKDGKKAIIASLDNAAAAVNGMSGTIITM